ncbi:MAG: motility associated factor glycosyltransferase family protein [Candidatus Melainabacteria bacterium]
MYFEKNCEALCREPRNENILNLLATVPPTVMPVDEYDDTPLPFLLQETTAGDYTLIVNGVPLHDLAGAVKEAKAQCDAECHAGVRSNHIVLGLGLGYLLDEVFQRSKGKIFLYEPNLPLLRFVLENVDLSEIFGSGRVYLAGRIQDLMVQLGARYIFGEPMDVLILKSHAYLMSSEIAMVMERLFTLTQSKRGDVSAGMVFHLNWIRHFFNNQQYLSGLVPFDRLLGVHAGKPALVISSGPSLDDVLPLLRSQGDKFVKIAVGGALRPLLAAGIKPDYAVFLDYEGPRQQLENLAAGTEDIPFILGPFSETACHTVPSLARYLVSLENYPYFAGWLDNVTGQRLTRFPSGGSVSLMATRVAMAMGCTVIILVGQDLALRGTQQYAGNIHVRFQGTTKIRLKNKEIQADRVSRLMEVKDAQGNTLKTMPDYFEYKMELETLARENAMSLTSRKLYNASVGGAFVEGFEHLSLPDILKRHDFAGEAATIPDYDHADPSLRFHLNPVVIDDAIQRLLPLCEEAIRLGERVVEELNHILEAKPQLWEHLVVRYREFRNAFNALLDEQPMIQFFVKRELWTLQRQYRMEPATLADHQHNFSVDRQYFQDAVRTLRNEILPILHSTLQGELTPNEPAVNPVVVPDAEPEPETACVVTGQDESTGAPVA